MPLPEGSLEKMEESLISGETLPGNQFISHMGQAASRGTLKTLYPPERFSNHMVKWTAMEGWTGPMVSCQQTDLGRGQGA